MDKSALFEQYRNEYLEFYYNDYSIIEDNDSINLEYDFEIKNLIKFNPKIKILKKNKVKNFVIDDNVRNMAFHIGMVELISYWKSTCAPKVIIKCGNLTDDQKAWWKKLYYYGLGELFFTNNIKTSMESFMTIECQSDKVYNVSKIEDNFSGYIVPIGGGKDSVVTLETLKADRKNDYCLIINPKPVTLKCAEVAGFENDNIIEIYRTIDKNIIELNQKGYINGHTPFSAMLAFVSYFTAYIFKKKYVALSNENSANESNVVGEKVNHQYSKSFEFEKDFEYYSNNYLKMPIKYFSFLRPLNELQIAKIFSRHKKYHTTFKSCNVGSKEKEWIWCCNCAKCLFAYIILSPYLYKEEIVNIFGEDLYEKESLKTTFIELTGNGETKPFDCVGTFDEVKFAITKVIEKLECEGKELPYLLKYYKDNYKLEDTSNDITKLYNEENNLTEEQDKMLREEVFIK